MTEALLPARHNRPIFARHRRLNLMPENLPKASPALPLSERIAQWSHELGFASFGISDIDLSEDESRLQRWLAAGYQADMAYMSAHGSKRSKPEELHPGTISVICLRMDYQPVAADAESVLREPSQAYISRYALGRDYHKMMRKRLKKLAEKIQAEVTDLNYRVFVDSAPVMEKALARKAGLGWQGRNSLILNREAGSAFFLGEIYTNLDLCSTLAKPAEDLCGSCVKCIDLCPTGAILPGKQVDAGRCISYLTIENRGSIPEELRSQIGNRIFGCDDCQLVCPWNRYAQPTAEADFSVRHGLDAPQLTDLYQWTEEEFLQRTEGMALRRAGYHGWLRNIALALGNADYSEIAVRLLQARSADKNPIVAEHARWALEQQLLKKPI